MSLLEQITQDMKSAMKAKNTATLSTLRMLLSAMKNKKIDVQHELSDAEILDVVKSQVKQLKDSVVSFEQGNRQDLVDGANAEVAVLEKYLPTQMPDEELNVLVQNVILETGAKSKADMGRVMGASVKAAAGKADGSRIKDIVNILLPACVIAITSSFFALSASAAIPVIDDEIVVESQYPFSIQLGLRVIRVLILWFGVIGITMIINGGFQYMIACMRDDEHTSALSKITHGFFATIIVAGLFAIITVALQQLS